MKILYKLVTALLALAIFPILIFAPFFKLIVTSSMLAIFGSSGSEVLINDSYSLKKIYELLLPLKDKVADLSFSSLPEAVKDAIGVPALLFVIFLALALVCAIITLIFAVFTKKRPMVIVFAGLGAAGTLGMNIAFSNLAKPLVNGSLTIVDLLGEDIFSSIASEFSIVGSIVSSLFDPSKLIDIRLLNLSGAYVLMLLAFVAIIIWTISNILIEWE